MPQGKKQSLLNHVFDRIHDGIVALDSDWRYVFVNDRAVQMLQRNSKEDLLGKHIWTEFPEGIGQPFYHYYNQAFETQQVIIFEQYYQPWDLWYENRIYPSIDGITIYFTEITSRKKAEQSLKLFSTAYTSTRDGVFITDLRGKILNVNQAFNRITGYQESDLQGKSIDVLKSSQNPPNFYRKVWRQLIKKGYWVGEVWSKKKSNATFPSWLTITAVRNEKKQRIHYVGTFSDISQIKKSEKELEFLAHHDSLTGLPNRRLLFLRLEHCIESAQREQNILALLMLDLDHFKNVNDSFGHFAGDDLINQIGKMLSSRFRNKDTVSRLGGDEFTILLDEITHLEDAGVIANEVIYQLSQPWQLACGAEVRIGASIGISLYPNNGQTAEELLQQADTSLNLAKSDGRNTYRYFTQDLTDKVRKQIDLENKLQLAFEQKKLQIYYQPQVHILSGEIIGAEALLRWNDPIEGFISPAIFIPIAESSGLISLIGKWVLDEVSKQGQQWINDGLNKITLSVNISPIQFLHEDISELVTQALQDSQFPASCLTLELTESAFIDRENDAIEILAKLRGLNIQIALDDFGTGYSSLSYLKRFPLDTLKIDKSFIDDIPANQEDVAICAAIIAMAKALNLKTIAEGVETEQQLAFLSSQGCDILQGYVFSPAVTKEEFSQLLRQNMSRNNPLDNLNNTNRIGG